MSERAEMDRASKPRAVAARPPLEAVLFDAGGTLVRLDFEWMAAALRQLGLESDAATLRRCEIEGRRRYDHSAPEPSGSSPLGAAGDIHAYFGGMLAAAGMKPHLIGPAVVRLLAHEKSTGLWSRPMEGAREALDAVARLGLRSAAVSNSDGRAEWHLRRSEVLSGLEFVVDSQVVGIEKPDRRIFDLALQRLEIAPERAIYVGDILSVDEVGARAAGLHFVLIDPDGGYAGTGTAAIRSIAELPGYLERTFSVPQGQEKPC